MIRHALVCLALLAAAPAAHAQVISGTLMESESRAPLRSGVVALLDADSALVSETRTDSAGAFSFALPGAGRFRLRAASEGFRTAASPRLTMAARDTLDVEFSLARDVVMLEPLVVRARSRRLTPAARAFYDRAGGGATGGIFITRDEVARLRPMRTTDLLRRVPGMLPTAVAGGNDVTLRGGCRPTLFVDGTRVNGYRTIDDIVQPLDIEGVEVYRAAYEAPPQYTGISGGCAVVLIWTRIE